ncbi:MAG: HAMP domain-containing histidine kinase, partial [Actinomycetota bacterium]|nr:HAMP domain-containing histidine kinase [Actinomycetota bacterium]
MSLRTRLVVAFVYLLLLAVVALALPLGVNVARRASSDFAVQLTEKAEAIAAAVPAATRAGDDAVAALVRRQPELGRVIVVNDEGTLVADSTARRPLGTDYRYRGEIPLALNGQATRLQRTYPNAGTQYVVATPVVDGGRIVGAVRVNASIEQVQQRVRERLAVLAAVTLIVLAVGTAVAVAVAGSLTRPLCRLAATAGRLGQGDLHARVDEDGQAEVVEVATALNTMADRIERTLHAQRDFLANASHQLRTPLTGLRLRLEALTASGDRNASAGIAEVDRLGRLVDDLLTLLRAGVPPAAGDTTDPGIAAQEAVDRWAILAGDRGQRLTFLPSTVCPPVTVAEQDLEIALDNLIENALKYSPPGSTVTVALDRDGDDGVLTVADDGPGIPDDEREAVFERFYRGQGGAHAPGTGLGLAIVR